MNIKCDSSIRLYGTGKDFFNVIYRELLHLSWLFKMLHIHDATFNYTKLTLNYNFDLIFNRPNNVCYDLLLFNYTDCLHNIVNVLVFSCYLKLIYNVKTCAQMNVRTNRRCSVVSTAREMLQVFNTCT